jgi:hypothetical protein
MKTTLESLAIALLTLTAVVGVQAQTVVYDNLNTSATAGYSELTANGPIFGDALTLSQPGMLAQFSASLYNSSSGANTGSILTGTTQINFYDNTVPYTGGVLSNPLLGTGTLTWDFTGDGGLAAGFYDTMTADFSSLNINLPLEILVTQQFTLTGGTSTRNGVILCLDPLVGSSPNTVYIESASTSAGLYTFSGNPGQFCYAIAVVPEPTPYLAASLLVGFAAWHRCRRQRQA